MSDQLALIRGLRIDSDLPLGTFPHVTGTPDVTVRLGPASALAVRPSRPGRFEARAGHVFMGALGGGVVVARHGREILVDSRPGLDLRTLMDVVVSEGIDAILHQRAVTPTPLRPRAVSHTGGAAFAVEEILP